MKKQVSLLMLLPVAASAQQRPNIVYIMTDDHTAQMLSAYGNSPIQTPNLDRLASEGVLFRHSYVANSLSGPSRACCSPASTATRTDSPTMSTVCLTAASRLCPS